MERRMLGNSCSNNMKFFHHCKLSRHWEAKCWRLHPEHHPRNHIRKRRVWRVKIKRDEELPTSLIQREEAGEGDITTEEVNDTNKMYTSLISRVATLYLLFTLLYPKNPILKCVVY
jgi:hypothetical protein